MVFFVPWPATIDLLFALSRGVSSAKSRSISRVSIWLQGPANRQYWQTAKKSVFQTDRHDPPGNGVIVRAQHFECQRIKGTRLGDSGAGFSTDAARQKTWAHRPEDDSQCHSRCARLVCMNGFATQNGATMARHPRPGGAHRRPAGQTGCAFKS